MNKLCLCGWELVCKHLDLSTSADLVMHHTFFFSTMQLILCQLYCCACAFKLSKLLAGCSKEFSVELYGEWHLQCVQDVVVQKLRLQGGKGCTGGHGAAHQMNLA